MQKYSFVKQIILFSLICVLLSANIIFACDLVGIASGNSAMSDDAIETSMLNLRSESNPVNDNGWGFLAWNNNYIPSLYREDHNNNVWVDALCPLSNDDWDDNFGIFEPQLFIANARAASSGGGTEYHPNPHPFIYKLNGRTLAMVHNGTINDSPFRSIFNTLITREYNYLDFQNRYYGDIDNTNLLIDSEVLGKLLMKNVLLADNYNLGDDWAINRTYYRLNSYSDYVSYNILYSNGEEIFAVRKVNPTYTIDLQNHRLKTRTFGTAPDLTYAVISDDDLMANWDEIENNHYSVLKDNSGIITDNEALCQNNTYEAPSFQDYKLDEYTDNSTYGSQYAKVASNGHGYFAAVWRERNNTTGKYVIKARVTNQLGLAEQLEIPVYDYVLCSAHYANIVGDPVENSFYVVYARTLPNASAYTQICMRKLTYEESFTDLTHAYSYNGEYLMNPIYKWVVGDEIVVNSGTSGSNTNSVYWPAVDTDSTHQVVVWQHRGDSNYYEIKERKVEYPLCIDNVITIANETNTHCQRPDIQFLCKTNNGLYSHFAIAWSQSNGSTLTNGINAKKHLINNQYSFLDLMTNQVLLYNISSSYASSSYPNLTLNGSRWLCSFREYTSSTSSFVRNLSFKSDPDVAPSNPNGVTNSDPWESELASIDIGPFYIISPYLDVAGNPDGGFDLVFSGKIMSSSDYQITKMNLSDYDLMGTSMTIGLDDNAISGSSYTYAPLYPSIAISDAYGKDTVYGQTRTMVVWEKRWSSSEGRKITANFSPWHFRTTAFKEIGQPSDSDADVPLAYKLENAYPNPFNPSTTIAFTLPEVSNVKISVFNIQGQLVADLVNEVKTAGRHQVVFDGSNLSSGIYFVRMHSGDFVQSKKIILTK